MIHAYLHTCYTHITPTHARDHPPTGKEKGRRDSLLLVGSSSPAEGAVSCFVVFSFRFWFWVSSFSRLTGDDDDDDDDDDNFQK